MTNGKCWTIIVNLINKSNISASEYCREDLQVEHILNQVTDDNLDGSYPINETNTHEQPTHEDEVITFDNIEINTHPSNTNSLQKTVCYLSAVQEQIQQIGIWKACKIPQYINIDLFLTKDTPEQQDNLNRVQFIKETVNISCHGKTTFILPNMCNSDVPTTEDDEPCTYYPNYNEPNRELGYCYSGPNIVATTLQNRDSTTNTITYCIYLTSFYIDK